MLVPDRPVNTRSILDRIRGLTGVKEEGSPENQRRYRDLAHTVVGQMLPVGAVKGGAAMYFRYGNASRFSVDLDVSQALAVTVFHEVFQERLAEGWGGFTGTITERAKARPEGVPSQHVLQPYAINLFYEGSKWPHTITFELSRDELDSTAAPEHDLSPNTIELFEALGLPDPAPVPLVPIIHQVAQKLHAVTLADTERAHDLIDLQLLLGTRIVDMADLATTTRRLFELRGTHPWPAVVEPTSRWAALYQAALEGMNPEEPAVQVVVTSLESAVEWANIVLAILVSLDGRSTR